MLTAGALLLSVLWTSVAWPAFAQQPAAFSSATAGQAPPAGWRLQPIPSVARQTRFDLVEDDGRTVLRARADDAAASLRHAISVDPARTPLLRWRWKTDRVLAKADMASKAGDDYAARLYVFFDRTPAQMSFGERALYRIGRARYGDQLPAAALSYVWDNRQPVGTLRDNAYTGFVKMVVASTGKAREGQWVSLSRDVAADYRRAFGGEPPRITGVAVAVDTDNTGESTITWFGDIRFEPAGAVP
ncbi:DUF3047 domain-containing protein [Luteimonas vadosa]|uniref:DUF3047 domain-containing protein n=1 Tax=Luteimonas vadosa TaxID=1165507 RepID=A0ABP9DP69_9GAMM